MKANPSKDQLRSDMCFTVSMAKNTSNDNLSRLHDYKFSWRQLSKICDIICCQPIKKESV